MKRAEVLRALDRADRDGVWAFTTKTFSAMMGGVEGNYLKVALGRLSAPEVDVVRRVTRGIYYNPRARSLPSAPGVEIARFLRPREQSYLSFESVLSEAGAISQVTQARTFATTGASWAFDTQFGRIEFTRVEGEPFTEEAGVIRPADGGMPFATVARAFRDLTQAGRNLALVDGDELADIIEDQERSLRASRPVEGGPAHGR